MRRPVAVTRAGAASSAGPTRVGSSVWAVTLAAASLLAGCVADGGYVGGDATVGYGVDYYEPYGYDYGVCCGRYYVGPPGHGGYYGHGPGWRPGLGDHPGPGGHPGDGRPGPRPQNPRPYRAAPSSRSAPSIPTGPRGGGGHPGGHH